MLSKAKETSIKVEEICKKPFGFQVQVYKGKVYLVGREMYNPDPDSPGYATIEEAAKHLVFGRNGVNIPIEGAGDYIKNMIITLAESMGVTIEDVMQDVIDL